MGLGVLPDVEPGTSGWWATKPAFLVLNALVLVPIVRLVAPIERRALLSGAREWRGGTASVLLAAALVSVSIKAWSSPEIGLLIAGLVGTLVAHRLVLGTRSRRRAEA
jgi:hypothetical protein